MKNKKNIFSRKLVFVLAIFVVVVSIFFVSWQGVSAAEGATGSTMEKSSEASGGLMSSVVGGIGNAMAGVFNHLLLMVFMFMGFLLVIAGTIFDWAINPANFEAVMKLEAIKSGWIMVRDFLNVGFILVLLYSAFCTVFQVQSFNTKKIIIMLVIMALLINFSFPIARFIIDVGNVTMYYLLNIKFGGMDNKTSVAVSIVEFSKITYNLGQGGNGLWSSEVTVQMLASIVFIFLLASTLLILGILFVIRILVLAIVIIFSPIGFIGQIFPGASTYSGMWWDALFKQSFFGVVMAFMIVISMNIMEQIGNGGIFNDMKQATFSNIGTGGGDYSSLIVTGTYMAIPITLLWLGIIAAQKMGAYGADSAKKYVNKGMNWAAMAPLRYSGIQGGAKKGWENFTKTGKVFGKQLGIGKLKYGGSDALEAREEKWGGFMKKGPKGWSEAKDDTSKKLFNEAAKKAAERIGDNEDSSTIVTNINRTGALNAATSKGDLENYMGRYKQIKSDAATRQQFESEIRTDSARINAAIAHAQTALVGSGLTGKAYDSALESHKDAYMDTQVRNEYANLDTKYQTARTLHKDAK